MNDFLVLASQGGCCPCNILFFFLSAPPAPPMEDHHASWILMMATTTHQRPAASLRCLVHKLGNRWPEWERGTITKRLFCLCVGSTQSQFPVVLARLSSMHLHLFHPSHFNSEVAFWSPALLFQSQSQLLRRTRNQSRVSSTSIQS